MLKNNFEVEVLVNGHTVREYFHEGRVFVEGRKGIEYSLKVKNNSSRRILAIPTIDGLSVINGKPATLESPGYIIRAYDTQIIDGWRKSDKEVAKFIFSDSDKSYASDKGNGGNQGVIGIAIFYEKECYNYHLPSLSIFNDVWNPLSQKAIKRMIDISDKIFDSQSPPANSTWTLNSHNTTCSNNMNCEDKVYTMSGLNAQGIRIESSTINSDLGTGWGDNKKSEITEVDFDKNSYAEAIFEIFYASIKTLEKIGVKIDQKPIYIAPQAFPGKYCEPPQK